VIAGIWCTTSPSEDVFIINIPGIGQTDVKLRNPRYDLETIKQFPAAKAMN
jgi:hypothetical protein